MHLPISLSDLSATEKEINIEPTDKNLQFHRHTILTKINLSIGSSSTQSTITFSNPSTLWPPNTRCSPVCPSLRRIVDHTCSRQGAQARHGDLITARDIQRGQLPTLGTQLLNSVVRHFRADADVQLAQVLAHWGVGYVHELLVRDIAVG
jgi:hypothetical protein